MLLIIGTAADIVFFTMGFIILLRILPLLLSVFPGINALPCVDHFPVLFTVHFLILPVLIISGPCFFQQPISVFLIIHPGIFSGLLGCPGLPVMLPMPAVHDFLISEAVISIDFSIDPLQFFQFFRGE